MKNWDAENQRRERRIWLVLTLAVILALAATAAAYANPLPPGKPAGIHAANLRNTELDIFVALPIVAVVAVVVFSAENKSATSTGK